MPSIDIGSIVGGIFEFVIGLCVVIAIFCITASTNKTNELLTEMLGPLRLKEGRDPLTGKPLKK